MLERNVEKKKSSYTVGGNVNLYGHYGKQYGDLKKKQLGLNLWPRTMAENEEELKSILMKVKEGEWKSWLKTQYSENQIMASGPIISWQIDGETVTEFIFLGSKITADGDCSHEIKICLLLGWKAMTNLDSILKSRDVTLPTKSVQSKLWFFQ